VLLPYDMDIARPDLKQKKKRQMFVYAGAAVVVIAIAVVIVARLKPAAPPVDRSAIWTDTVKRGPMIRQVRGSTGTLVPREDSILLIPALTDATVVRIRVLPGAKVNPDDILLDLADPQLNQQLLSAKLAQQQAEADYTVSAIPVAKHVDGQKNNRCADRRRLFNRQAAGRYRCAALQLGVVSGLVCGASKTNSSSSQSRKKSLCSSSM